MKSLFQEGKELFAQKSYLASLTKMLEIRHRHLDYCGAWQFNGDIALMQLRDVNTDGRQELGVCTSMGEFHVCFPDRDINPFNTDRIVHCSAFCFTGERKDDDRFLFLTDSQTDKNVIWSYKILRQGDGIILTNPRNMFPVAPPGRVLDIDFKNGRIYFSTSDCWLHVYNAIRLTREGIPLSVSTPLKRLVTGGLYAAQNPSASMHMKLIGIGNDATLHLFDVESADTKEMSFIHNSSPFTDCFVTDFDNTGTDDLIGCSMDGMLSIFEWGTFHIRYTLNLCDDLLCLTCHDIDYDGEQEIVVGGASGQIYVVGLNERRELETKWSYPTERPVLSLRVDTTAATHGNLFAGLAGGKVCNFRYYNPKNVKTEIHRAYQGLRDGAANLRELFSKTEDRNLLEFGLREYAILLPPRDLLPFLESIRSKGTGEARICLASELATLLARHPQYPMLVQFALSFLTELYLSEPDPATAQHVLSALDRIANTSAVEAGPVFELSERLKKDFHDRRFPRRNRIKSIKESICSGTFESAREELAKLQKDKINLLGEYQMPIGGRILGYSNAGRVAIAVDGGKQIQMLNEEKSELTSLVSFQETAALCCPSERECTAYVICHGPKLARYRVDGDLLKEDTYDLPFVCIQSCRWNSQLLFVAGQENGALVVGDEGASHRIGRLPSAATHIAMLVFQNELKAYAFCKNCRIYDIGNTVLVNAPVAQEDAQPAASREVFSFGRYLDVIRFAAVRHDDSSLCLVVLHRHGEFLLSPAKGTWQAKEISLNRLITCGTILQPRSGSDWWAIAGTRNESVIALNANGEPEFEAYLPSTPTSLTSRCMADNREFVVGLADGGLRKYDIPSPSMLSQFLCACDLSEEYKRDWNTKSLHEKLVLAVISRGDSGMTIDEIHEALGEGVRCLVNKDNVLRTVTRLVDIRLVARHGKGSEYRYTIPEIALAEWISTEHSPISILTDHRLNIMDIISLSAAYLIDQEFRTNGKHDWWLYEFAAVDPAKWADLCKMSRLRAQAFDPTAADKDRAVAEYFEFMFEKFGVAPSPHAPRSPRIQPGFAVFSLCLPGIRFRGFDNICVVLFIQPAISNISALQDLLMNLPPACKQIVLLICPEDMDKTLIRESLRHVTDNYVILDEREHKDLLLSASPARNFRSHVVEHVRISGLSPFQKSGPVTDMFYGRSKERSTVRNAITHRSPKNIAILGPRKIGKTSLLWSILREFERSALCAIVDCSSTSTVLSLYIEILRRLNIIDVPRERDDFVRLLQDYRKQNKRRKIVLFLDEVDQILKLKDSDEFFLTLRALVNDASDAEVDDVKIIIAGYKLLYYSMQEDNHPLRNLFDKLPLADLDNESARQMITESFHGVIDIESEAVEQILLGTGRYPNFIQWCCSSLVEMAGDKSGRVIRRPDVDTVIASKEFHDEIVNAYLRQLDASTRLVLYLLVCHYDAPLGSIIVDRERFDASDHSQFMQKRDKYVIKNTFEAYDIHRILEIHGIHADEMRLADEMNKLVLACIVKEATENRYQFVLSDLPAILSRHEIVEKTVDLLERKSRAFKPQ